MDDRPLSSHFDVNHAISQRVRENKSLIDEAISNGHLALARTLLIPFLRAFFEEIKVTRELFDKFSLSHFVALKRAQPTLRFGNLSIRGLAAASENEPCDAMDYMSFLETTSAVQLGERGFSVFDILKSEAYHGIIHLRPDHERHSQLYAALMAVPHQTRDQILVNIYQCLEPTVNFLIDPKLISDIRAPNQSRQPRIVNQGIIETLNGHPAAFFKNAYMELPYLFDSRSGLRLRFDAGLLQQRKRISELLSIGHRSWPELAISLHVNGTKMFAVSGSSRLVCTYGDCQHVDFQIFPDGKVQLYLDGILQFATVFPRYTGGGKIVFGSDISLTKASEFWNRYLVIDRISGGHAINEWIFALKRVDQLPPDRVRFKMKRSENSLMKIFK